MKQLIIIIFLSLISKTVFSQCLKKEQAENIFNQLIETMIIKNEFIFLKNEKKLNYDERSCYWMYINQYDTTDIIIQCVFEKTDLWYLPNQNHTKKVDYKYEKNNRTVYLSISPLVDTNQLKLIKYVSHFSATDLEFRKKKMPNIPSHFSEFGGTSCYYYNNSSKNIERFNIYKGYVDVEFAHFWLQEIGVLRQ